MYTLKNVGPSARQDIFKSMEEKNAALEKKDVLLNVKVKKLVSQVVKSKEILPRKKEFMTDDGVYHGNKKHCW